jgi:hypothetical protein
MDVVVDSNLAEKPNPPLSSRSSGRDRSGADIGACFIYGIAAPF